MIYLDHAATAPLRTQALDAMLPYLSGCFANASSSYAAAREARMAIDRARSEIAAAIGAGTGEVYLTSGGSEADNWALFGAARACSSKRHILTTRIEHHAVLHCCQALERLGWEATYLEVDDQGCVSPDAVERAIRPDTAMVSVMMANNETGVIEPIAEIAQIAHAHGTLMHTDAVQAVGHIPVDVRMLGVDLLSISAHKFGGPKGIGALFVRSGIRMENLIYGGAQERGLRAGTENTPSIVGMGCAIRLATEHMEEMGAYVAGLRDAMQAELAALPGVRVNSARAKRLPGHLHLTIDNADSALLLMQLDMAGVAASAGSACTSGLTERSHVIEAMGLAGENQADIRFSIGESNTEEEIEAAVRTLRRILKR